MHDERGPQVRWRVLVLVGVMLTIAFTGVGLMQIQSHQVVRCTISDAEGAAQEYEFGIDDQVGEGCRYAVDAALAAQRARWWWFAGGAVLMLTFASLPLATLRRTRRRHDDRDPG